MKRWIRRLKADGEAADVDAFLAEVAAVCAKHGLSLGHYGSFQVERFDPYNITWLMNAADNREDKP